MSSLKYWIWLSSLRRVGPRQAGRIIEHFGSPEQAYFADGPEYERAGFLTRQDITALMEKSLDTARDILDKCADNNFRVITIGDAEYPSRLRNIYDPPVVLYIRGWLPVIDEEAAVAIVGTRKATPYGVKAAEKVGYEFTKAGGLVVSGLARGIDSAAARGALRAGGSVLGVAATGLDVDYPKGNDALLKDISDIGAIISEYPPGTEPFSGNFPVRNRILSGVSVGVAVIEAPRSSGALITAARALEQGRDVFALPGNVDADACAGSNELLKEGAALFTSGWDIAEEYKFRWPEKLGRAPRKAAVDIDDKSLRRLIKNELGAERHNKKAPEKIIDNTGSADYIDVRTDEVELKGDEYAVARAFSEPEMHIDDLILTAGLPAARVLSVLTMLEIKDCVTQMPGKRFKLKVTVK